MKRILLIISVFTLFLTYGQTNWTINSSGSTWSPNNLTIQQGDSVTWVNTGGTHNINGTTATFPSNPESFGDLTTGTGWTYGHRFNVPGTYNYRCDVHAGTMTGVLVVQASSASIEEARILKVNIGPNPVNNVLTVSCNASSYNVLIYDMLGNLVKSKTLQKQDQIDVSNLNSGPYWIEIKTDSDVYTQKLIKR